MNGVFCALMLAGLLYAAATGRPDAAQRALLSGGGEAVGLLMRLAGAYAFFGGLLGVLRESGAADALARAMEKPLSRLFRFAPGEEAALGDVSLNLSANMLGAGGAAMPAILIEMGFIDNDHDVILLENKQDAIAKAIARGVTDYANL